MSDSLPSRSSRTSGKSIRLSGSSKVFSRPPFSKAARQSSGMSSGEAAAKATNEASGETAEKATNRTSGQSSGQLSGEAAAKTANEASGAAAEKATNKTSGQSSGKASGPSSGKVAALAIDKASREFSTRSSESSGSATEQASSPLSARHTRVVSSNSHSHEGTTAFSYLPSLPASFFARPTLQVAKELLGKTLVRRISDGRLAAHEIVEVEAYTQDDPACHAFNGPTKRSAILFGPPGVAYVYFIYGMYHCLNAVTELDGIAGAVLIRGLRGEKLGGPGKLCRELNIDLAHNGLLLFETSSEIYFAPGRDLAAHEFEVTPRIGISKAQDRLWRYVVKEESSVRHKRRK